LDRYLNGISAYELSFSQDGNLIAYTRYPEHTIWVAHADGSEPLQLTPAGIEAHQPHWSPDGRRIACMARELGKPWHILIVDAGTKSISWPIASGDDQGVPTWSRDGRSLMFGDHLLVKDHREMRIRLFDELTNQLSVLSGSTNLWTPRWSPDGTYISALRPDGTALLLSRPRSGEWKTVFEGLALDDSMWSHDSKSIFLMASSAPGTKQLVLVQVGDGRVERLADVLTFPVTEEQWFGIAPDGSMLGLKGVFSEEIYALDYKLH
jgi:Tol biopolymer transport system component